MVESGGTVHSGLSKPSLFNPPNPIALSINVFRDFALKDLEKLPTKNINEHPESRVGLKQLCERKNRIVRPTNKGGGIVVLDNIDYQN